MFRNKFERITKTVGYPQINFATLENIEWCFVKSRLDESSFHCIKHLVAHKRPFARWRYFNFNAKRAAVLENNYGKNKGIYQPEVKILSIWLLILGFLKMINLKSSNQAAPPTGLKLLEESYLLFTWLKNLIADRQNKARRKFIA